MKWLKWPAVLSAASLAVLLAVLALGASFYMQRQAVDYRVVLVGTRDSVDREVWRRMDAADATLLAFYAEETGRADVASLLLAAARLNQIPVHVLFALAWRESGFGPRVVNATKNADGTKDIGVMALNSRVYKEHAEERLKDPAFNIQLGAVHLRRDFDKYGSWEEALVAYNSGDTDRPPSSTIIHLAKILEKERELDMSFALAFGQSRVDQR